VSVPPEITPSLILQLRTRIPKGLPSESTLTARLVDAVRIVLGRAPVKLPKRDIELGIVLTDDEGIKVINRVHRKMDVPTDVLSFPLHGELDLKEPDQPEGPPLALGDIVISLETIGRQAADRNLPIHERFAECLVHGMLHILGYEHSTEKSREKMESLEDELVNQVADVLAP
jgi:probable rRNA maturation factor